MLTCQKLLTVVQNVLQFIIIHMEHNIFFRKFFFFFGMLHFFKDSDDKNILEIKDCFNANIFEGPYPIDP